MFYCPYGFTGALNHYGVLDLITVRLGVVMRYVVVGECSKGEAAVLRCVERDVFYERW